MNKREAYWVHDDKGGYWQIPVEGEAYNFRTPPGFVMHPAGEAVTDSDILWDMRLLDTHLKDSDSAIPVLVQGVRRVLRRVMRPAEAQGGGDMTECGHSKYVPCHNCEPLDAPPSEPVGVPAGVVREYLDAHACYDPSTQHPNSPEGLRLREARNDLDAALHLARLPSAAPALPLPGDRGSVQPLFNPQPPAEAQPGEWVLVPREPTLAMVIAWRDAPDVWVEAYAAMLHAAPPPPAEAQPVGRGCGDHDHASYIPGCGRCASTLPEKRMAAPPSAPVGAYTYASTQATKCAGCGEHEHTPLRIDAMGGYVCLTCIDQKLGSLLGEFGHTPSAPVGVEGHVKALSELRDTGDVSDWRLFESALDAAIATLAQQPAAVDEAMVERATMTLRMHAEIEALRKERDRAVEAGEIMARHLDTLEPRAERLAEALRDLEVCANTVDYCYTRNPGNFAVALRELRESAERSRAALRDHDQEGKDG